MPTTNYKLKGWHRGIQVMFQGSYPNIRKLIRSLEQEQILQHVELKSIEENLSLMLTNTYIEKKVQIMGDNCFAPSVSAGLNNISLIF